MAIADMLYPDNIKAPLEKTEKNGIILELLTLLYNSGRISDLDKAFEAIRKREDQGSTGLGEGIAVPHAKTDLVSSLTLALGVAPQGVDFDSLDGKPTRLFFLLLAPPDQSGPHVEALSEVAKISRSASFMRLLCSARSPEEVLDLFGD
ncbi:PTS sugar transporter subunit IIA [Marispirochaeta sp.]|jgi:nitrogen PTS system EIIA component|uniref:PTS sugar transporter subunit IIA n=1 Tax=Marispirochaeta sp. TaxID=2038653 RepID=UPI0029C7F9B4|nr:PTS sugar transporter subunit IIA [Marispirochaeta sp.]